MALWGIEHKLPELDNRIRGLKPTLCGISSSSLQASWLLAYVLFETAHISSDWELSKLKTVKQKEKQK